MKISCDPRHALLWAVGIGSRNLRFVCEGHPALAAFPTCAMRRGGAGAPIARKRVPNAPGLLNINAERCLERRQPLPTAGAASARSRAIGSHPGVAATASSSSRAWLRMPPARRA